MTPSISATVDVVEPDIETPLLLDTTGPGQGTQGPDYHGLLDSQSSAKTQPGTIASTRSLEDDVLPETAVLGRNLGWSSAYILIISRVIGSGIFATPGAVVRSAGSIGLSLLLWIAGALISWCGLAVSLEYGCMLPRSGGSFETRRIPPPRELANC